MIASAAKSIANTTLYAVSFRYLLQNKSGSAPSGNTTQSGPPICDASATSAPPAGGKACLEDVPSLLKHFRRRRRHHHDETAGQTSLKDLLVLPPQPLGAAQNANHPRALVQQAAHALLPAGSEHVFACRSQRAEALVGLPDRDDGAEAHHATDDELFEREPLAKQPAEVLEPRLELEHVVHERSDEQHGRTAISRPHFRSPQRERLARPLHETAAREGKRHKGEAGQQPDSLSRRRRSAPRTDRSRTRRTRTRAARAMRRADGLSATARSSSTSSPHSGSATVPGAIASSR